jgi:hypothetical protein
LQKKPKSKAMVGDADDEASVFDDADFPLEGSGEVDDPMLIDAEPVCSLDVCERTLPAIDELRFIFSAFQIGEPTNDTLGHRATQSLDECEHSGQSSRVIASSTVGESDKPPIPR